MVYGGNSLLTPGQLRNHFWMHPGHVRTVQNQLRRAAPRLLVNRLSTYLHSRWPCIVCCWLTSHPGEAYKHWWEGNSNLQCSPKQRRYTEKLPVLNVCSHCHKSLFYISGIFCTCFHERNANFIRKCLLKPKVNKERSLVDWKQIWQVIKRI